MLFEEKLDLFAALLAEEPVTWSGTTRAPLDGQQVYPPTASGRAAHLGRRRRQPRVGRAGRPLRPAPDARHHRRRAAALRAARRPVPPGARRVRVAPQPVGVHSPGHVADTDEQAREELWPHYSAMHARIGRERGWPPMTRAQFDAAAGPDGALFVGSPETVAAKIVRGRRPAWELSRFDLKYSAGTLPHELMLRSIELYGTKVAPMVRERARRRLTPRAGEARRQRARQRGQQHEAGRRPRPARRRRRARRPGWR